MPVSSLLIANRGEIAIRIARTASDMGIRTVSIASDADKGSMHVRATDEHIRLAGEGAAAYLNIEQIIDAARVSGCDAIHPGYGFLSENADLARACEAANIKFVGPTPDTLDLFGDKVRARAFALSHGVPLARGTNGATSLAEIRDFYRSIGDGARVMIKAVAGGGGRGMREVHDYELIESAMQRCQSEAIAAFGVGDLYVEEIVRDARHVEVQIVGDGKGGVSHLYERECSLQRRHQKLIEIAPCPNFSDNQRQALTRVALRLARAANYRGLGTFEFLIGHVGDGQETFVFMEANPRLQVEHTVTEEVLGLDLVRAQLDIAGGSTLEEIGFDQDAIPQPRGYAIQARINMENLQPDGSTLPASGTLRIFEPSTGPGIRVDTFGQAGYQTTTLFDSLLAKVVAHAPMSKFPVALKRLQRALDEFRIEGVQTNLPFLRSLLADPAVAEGRYHTRFVENNLARLIESVKTDALTEGMLTAGSDIATVLAPLQGRLVEYQVSPGAAVAKGATVAVIEAMKMEITVTAPVSGTVGQWLAKPGDMLATDQSLITIEPSDNVAGTDDVPVAADLDAVRPDLQALLTRRAKLEDGARPKSVEKRHKLGYRTARENLADLFDADSFVEYGGLSVPAQRRRRKLEDLIDQYPADGIVTGVGHVNSKVFDGADTRCMALAYDYTVLAGTQGIISHRKKDRMLQLAEQWRIPVVTFAEGGGGRPGDTDHLGVSGADSMTFARFARLSGQVPLVGIVAGRCFAGNAALLGCCDVVIATRNSNIGMAGPAMIEGGGLGSFKPEDVGPSSVQSANGVIDILVDDEAGAVAAAKRYLGYFQGHVQAFIAPDQRKLRHAIPTNRKRSHDVRIIIDTLFDEGSVLELRSSFATGIVTAFARLEGRPVGVIANNCLHLAGAIDAEGADKSARFMQLCEAFGIPLVSLCDTPGFMVGPEAEKTALVRHVSRMFVTAAAMTVPIVTVILRKSYGLGAMAMAAGSTHVPLATIAWPTAEFGGMNIEGAVQLAYRAEMDALEPAERQVLFQSKVDELYERGAAVNVASYLEVDDVIDPATTRETLVRLMRMPSKRRPQDQRTRFIDTW